MIRCMEANLRVITEPDQGTTLEVAIYLAKKELDKSLDWVRGSN